MLIGIRSIVFEYPLYILLCQTDVAKNQMKQNIIWRSQGIDLFDKVLFGAVYARYIYIYKEVRIVQNLAYMGNRWHIWLIWRHLAQPGLRLPRWQRAERTKWCELSHQAIIICVGCCFVLSSNL